MNTVDGPNTTIKPRFLVLMFVLDAFGCGLWRLDEFRILFLGPPPTKFMEE